MDFHIPIYDTPLRNYFKYDSCNSLLNDGIKHLAVLTLNLFWLPDTF